MHKQSYISKNRIKGEACKTKIQIMEEKNKQLC